MIKLIIADDHEIVLEGLEAIINKDSNLSILGRAFTGRQVLDFIQKNEIDIAILDIEMPDIDGIETTIRLKKINPNIKVLILTMHEEISFIRNIVEAGANGYILKNKGKEELLSAIYNINNGIDYFSDEVTKIIISSLKSQYITGEIRLTRKEIEVLKLIADGNTTPQIALKLSIANSTVETHRRNLIEKTGAKNTKGLVKFAIQKGYL